MSGQRSKIDLAARCEEFIRAWNSDETRESIAKKYGVHPTYVSAIAKFLDLQTKPKGPQLKNDPVREKADARIYVMHVVMNIPAIRIAAQYGFSKTVVYTAVKRHRARMAREYVNSQT